MKLLYYDHVVCYTKSMNLNRMHIIVGVLPLLYLINDYKFIIESCITCYSQINIYIIYI